MSTCREISTAVDAYRDSLLSIDQFEDCFRNVAQGLFAYPGDARAVILSIENLLAELRAGYIDQAELRQELATAMRLFEDQSSNRAANNPDLPIRFPFSGSNSAIGSNAAIAA